MNRFGLLFIVLFFSGKSFAQIRFESGYFIEKSGEKINCLIRDVDWKNNPREFTYKLTEEGERLKKKVDEVMTFCIETEEKKVKYISTEVNIDRSSDIGSKLSSSRLPVWEKEQLFLKVLIEGEANLYYYEDKNLRRFFFNTSKNDSIQQLVYKRYRPEVTVAKSNNTFRQQLKSFVFCNTINQTKLEKLLYKKSNLVTYFKDYNEGCTQSDFESYFDKNSREKVLKLSLKVIGILNNAQFQITNSPSFDKPSLDFQRKTTVGGGLELEVFLPFNRNKWRLIAGSNLQYYNGSNEYELEFPTRIVVREASVEYSSIDILVGLRHYFYLNDKLKVFINGGYAYDVVAFDSYSKRSANSFEHEIIGNGTYFIGLGSEFKAMSLELRHYGSKNVINVIQDIANADIISSYSRLSINLGIRLF